MGGGGTYSHLHYHLLKRDTVHWVTKLEDSPPARCVDCETCWESFTRENDRVQDVLPQNMALWHVEFYKLKEFEKWHVREDCLTFPEVGLDPQMEVPSLCRRKGVPFSPKRRDADKTVSPFTLLSSHSFLSYCIFFHFLFTFDQT